MKIIGKKVCLYCSFFVILPRKVSKRVEKDSKRLKTRETARKMYIKLSIIPKHPLHDTK